ncbi:hypothetical protein PUN28_009243 [Cardiocondyla obscurior]|uniref:Uncharacterized protein n=1 Tax=Cardiocondyla obscurior TaxID=286306 RepID=A0AAW2FW72_9HYME
MMNKYCPNQPSNQPTNQPTSQAARMNPGDSVTELPQSAGNAGGCRLSSGAPGENLGGFDGEDTRCVGRKGQPAERRTMH